ncbi:MAG TPA: FxSxx-COOH system tetratricopeptide repeat protein [Nonomuraea sp.]|nr:FxSxx-COOH system tetratricopeptide repeat protein [Nonomuraea sp.]
MDSRLGLVSLFVGAAGLLVAGGIVVLARRRVQERPPRELAPNGAAVGEAAAKAERALAVGGSNLGVAMTGDAATAVSGEHVEVDVGVMGDIEVVGDVHVEPRPRVPTRPVQLKPRPPLLVGRDAVVAGLRERLAADRNRPGVVVVHGLGGVGKTSLALEYAHRYLHRYDLVWQLPAEEPAVLSAAFAGLAALLGVRENGGGADPVNQVHAALAAHEAPWLLIFDNAPEADELRPFLPPAGPGHVLVTSRSGNWPREHGLELPVLAPDPAAALLLARSGQDDRVAAAAVAAELGALPLALEQAGAFMAETGLPLADYLDLLLHHRGELLAQGQAWGYRERVTTTWQLAFRNVDRSSPQAIALLRVLACYAHEAIPYQLLLSQLERESPGELFRADVRRRQAYGRLAGTGVRLLGSAPGWVGGVRLMRELPRDPIAVNTALGALRRHSLIGQPVDGEVSVHRLVQAVTLDQLPPWQRSRWREVAAVLLEGVLPEDPERPESRPRYAQLLPHIRTVLTASSPGMDKTARCLGAGGDYRTARELFLEIRAALARALGEAHPATLTARHELARWTGELGHAAAARDQYAGLLPIYERVLGPEHASTLAIRHELARWTGELGDAAAARDQYAVLLPIYARVLGAEHPDTLTTRHSLAQWTGKAGDPIAARDQYAALLPIRRRVSGPEHPDTLIAQANLAQWTGQAGDAQAARDQYAALLPIRERVHGPEHPSTLINRHELARWTGELGDAAAARDQYAALLVVRERVSGRDHPATLTVRHELARWTGELGEAAAARDMYAALVPVRERVQGPEHPDSLTARASLAQWTGQAGDAQAARDQYAGLLPVCQRVLGPDHPDTLTACHELARWAGELGDAAAARDLYAVLVPVRERVQGPEHPDTLTARANLAYWTGRAGNARAARDQYAALLPVRERVLGPDHPVTRTTRHQLAHWTRRAGG